MNIEIPGSMKVNVSFLEQVSGQTVPTIIETKGAFRGNGGQQSNCGSNHRQPVETRIMIKAIWIRPQGSQGCQKMRQDPLNMPFEVWCTNIAPKLKNIQNALRRQVFLDIFFQF